MSSWFYEIDAHILGLLRSLTTDSLGDAIGVGDAASLLGSSLKAEARVVVSSEDYNESRN